MITFIYILLIYILGVVVSILTVALFDAYINETTSKDIINCTYLSWVFLVILVVSGIRVIIRHTNINVAELLYNKLRKLFGKYFNTFSK